ncbi:CRISPR-associated protein Cas7 [Prevotellamassilia timonensis]|uniref:CRISPR-associated protein Cas7 n=1 Tax=Prevotellamassilia timonensis TaxID=1852370 RepID=UPI0023F3F422|nr:CRISPR-associated protein Cas7 [Prevotellamassilia timonensis]MDD7440820.1 CRISPR-associated protein Cas7 [Prevotellamassilia timonensis]
MNKNSFIYLRGCKHAAFTVFCVEDGQKSYYDPQFNVRVPYSSGQQVKRSIMGKLNEVLNVEPSPTEFYFDVDKKGALKEGEVLSSCDPHYVDQLLGGWMRTPKGGKEKAVKRRSPLSISAMTPLHPLLASVPKENISFDRSDRPNVHKVVVRDASGNVLTDEQVSNFLNGSDRSLYRKWIPDNTRATGLFVYDVAIDLRRLFCVPTNQLEPEITSDMVETLKNDGWKVVNTVFGECLLMPKEQREKIIPAIADALIDWHITSNQARTFSLMETLAIAISDNANTLAAAIRAKLIDGDNDSKPKAKPIIDEHAGAATYVTLPCASYIVTETESADALDKAKQDLVNRMLTFDYENQL